MSTHIIVDDEAELDASQQPSSAATPNKRGSTRVVEIDASQQPSPTTTPNMRMRSGSTRTRRSTNVGMLNNGRSFASHANELGISGVESVEDLRREALNRIEVGLRLGPSTAWEPLARSPAPPLPPLPR